MIKFKKSIYIFAVFALLTGTFLGGVFFGYVNRPAIEKVANVSNKESAKSEEIDFSSFWQAWSVVESKFISSNNGDGLNNQAMVYGAIQGMVKSLDDPYTVFFPPEESKMFQDEIRGDFGGVGMELGMKNEILTVVSALKDTPAYRVGIKSGDKIVEIDGESTSGITVDKAVNKIRGEKGTKVNLTISREGEGELLKFPIIRDTIVIPTIDSEIKDGGIYVIKLYNFSATSSNVFKEELRKFVYSGNNKLILDLRGNPGGYLEAAVDISSWFLPAGKVVVQEKFGSGELTDYRSKGYNIFKDLPMIILVDKGTASASEIVAGALQEHGVAKLVGETTYGKGSVQELVQITKDTSLKVTIAKWLTPNGKSISKEGLAPDYKVEFTKKDFDAGKDPQMDKAIELLTK